jgi:murein DD-endopeptidase
MPELPTLGEPPKKSPLAGVAITAVVVGALAGGAYWWKSRTSEAPKPAPVAAAPAAPVAGAEAAAPSDPNAPAPTGAAPAAAPAAAPSAAPAVAAAPADPVKGGLKSFITKINGPMEMAIIGQVGKQVGAPLTQVVKRPMVWWLAVPNDLVKNDTLEAVYEERDSQEPLVHAVRYQSQKMGKTFTAFRYQPEGSALARFYDLEGNELELHLVDGPLDAWEQITSRLKDNRNHKGIDFKTPVGTPVKATFDGTIVRKNFNFRGAGNSLEVQETGGQGRVAKFFHLSELPKSVQPGQKVKRGEVIAKSGNTGHSFAPHLHYQLEKGGSVIDPFDSHKTSRVGLPAAELPRFKKETDRLTAAFGAGQVASAGGR